MASTGSSAGSGSTATSHERRRSSMHRRHRHHHSHGRSAQQQQPLSADVAGGDEGDASVPVYILMPAFRVAESSISSTYDIRNSASAALGVPPSRLEVYSVTPTASSSGSASSELSAQQPRYAVSVPTYGDFQAMKHSSDECKQLKLALRTASEALATLRKRVDELEGDRRGRAGSGMPNGPRVSRFGMASGPPMSTPPATHSRGGGSMLEQLQRHSRQPASSERKGQRWSHRVIVVGGGAGDSPGNGAASDGAGNVAASSSTGTAATEGAAPLDDRKQRGRRASVTSLQPLQGAHSASLPHSPDSPVAVLSPAGLRPAGRTLAAPLLAGGGGTSTRSLATSSPASRQWQRFERSQLPASRNMEGVSPINTSGQRGFPGGNTTSATNATAASDAPAGHTHTPERRAGSIPGTRRGGGARRPSQKLARHRRPRVGAAANVVAADDDTAATAATVVAASGGSATPSRSNGHGGRIGLSDSPSSGTGPSPSPPEDSYSDSGGGGGSGALTPTAPTARSAYSPMPFAAGGNGAMSNCRRHPHPRARTRRPTRGPGRAVGGDDSEGRVLTAPVAVGRPKTTKRDSHVGGAREPKYGNIISGDDVAPSSGAGAQRRPRVVPSVTSSFSSVSPLTAATGATGGSFGAISSASVSAGDVLSSAAPGATTVMVTAASSSASQATTVAPLLASGAPRSRSLRTLHSIPELKKMVASGETAGGVAAREDGLGQVAARGATNVGVLLQGPDSPIKASVQAAGFPSGGGAASRSSSPSRYDTVHPLAHKQPLRSSRPRGAPSGSNSLRPASVRQQRTVAAVASADAAGGEEGTTRRAVRRLSGGSISSVDSASGNNFRLGRVASPRPSARRGGGGAAGAGSGASSSNGAAASTQVAGPPSRRPQGRPRRQPSDVRRPTRSTSHTVASQLGVGHAASGGTAAMVDVESPAGVTGRTSMLLATPSPASLPSLSDTVSSPSPARTSDSKVNVPLAPTKRAVNPHDRGVLPSATDDGVGAVSGFQLAGASTNLMF